MHPHRQGIQIEYNSMFCLNYNIIITIQFIIIIIIIIIMYLQYFEIFLFFNMPKLAKLSKGIR